jgi:MFS family permease
MGAFFGAAEGLAIIIAPIIGGALVATTNWRWCFWINVPVGAICIFLITLFFQPPESKKASNQSWKEKFARIDFLGASVLIGSVTCLLLALQWGGTRYSWTSARIVTLLVIFGISFVCFIGIQIWKKDNAMLPERIFKQRTVIASTLYRFSVAGSVAVVSYYVSEITSQNTRSSSDICSFRFGAKPSKVIQLYNQASPCYHLLSAQWWLVFLMALLSQK